MKLFKVVSLTIYLCLINSMNMAHAMDKYAHQSSLIERSPDGSIRTVPKRTIINLKALSNNTSDLTPDLKITFGENQLPIHLDGITLTGNYSSHYLDTLLEYASRITSISTSSHANNPKPFISLIDHLTSLSALNTLSMNLEHVKDCLQDISQSTSLNRLVIENIDDKEALALLPLLSTSIQSLKFAQGFNAHNGAITNENNTFGEALLAYSHIANLDITETQINDHNLALLCKVISKLSHKKISGALPTSS